MTHQTRNSQAREAAGALMAIIMQLDDLNNMIRNSSPGIRAATYDQPMVKGGLPSNNQTFLASKDQSRVTERRINNELHEIYNRTLNLSEYVTQQLASQDVTITIERDPICAITGEPVFRTGNVGKRLNESLPLSRWAYDFVRSHRRLPTRSEVNRAGRKDIRIAAEKAKKAQAVHV